MLINTTAYRAGSGGIARVNEFDNHTCESGLIFDEAPKLAESPRVLLSPLSLSNRDAVSNPLKVFKGDTSTAVFCLRNNTLADYMVSIGSKSLFLAGALFKKPFSLLRAVGLKFRPHLGVSLSKTTDGRTGVESPIRVGSDVLDTQVYAQKAIRLIRCWLRGINHNCQVKNAITENKVGLSNLSIESSFLISTNPDRDKLATLKSKNRDLVQSLPREDALVIDHSRVGLEDRLNRAVSFVGFRDFTNSTDSHLGRKPKTPNISINSLLKAYLISCFKFKGKSRDVVARFVKSLHSAKKSLVLFLTGGKLNQKGLYHTISIACSNLYVKSIKRRYAPIPPTPKGMVFLGAFL